MKSVLLAILLAAPAAAQVREQVTVELVEIPVYVVNRDGQPVRGLTKDAFELRVNGRRQPIEYFDAIDFAAPAPPPRGETPSPVDDRVRLRLRGDPPRHADARGESSARSAAHLRLARRTVRMVDRREDGRLFDAANALPGYLARAQRAAHYAVDHSNAGSDLFAVATYTSKKGVQFEAPGARTALVPISPASHRDSPVSKGRSTCFICRPVSMPCRRPTMRGPRGC